MKKRILIPIIIVAVLIIIGAIAYFNVTHSATVDAQLFYTSGAVSVNGVDVSVNQQLKEGDVVETGDSGTTVVIQESVSINLAAHTKIRLADLDAKNPAIELLAGSTTNNFAHSTTVESFRVIQGDKVTTAYGTIFLASDIKTILLEGSVVIEQNGRKVTLTPSMVYSRNAAGEYTSRPLTAEERQSLLAEIASLELVLKNLQEAEFKKNGASVAIISKATHIPPEDMMQQLRSYDTQTAADVDALVAQSPVQIQSVNKMAAWEKEIQRLTALRADMG